METEYGVAKDDADAASIGLAKSLADVDLNQTVVPFLAEARFVDLRQHRPLCCSAICAWGKKPMSPKSTANAVLDQRLIQGLVPRLRIFWGVPPPSLGPLIRQCWVLAAPRGTKVVQRGASLPGVFALAYGSIKLSLRGDDAEERVVSLVSAGHTFGEEKALLGRTARDDAIALADSKLVVIPSAAILSLMDREPRFARALVFVLAERTVDLLAEVESATQRGAQRLASYLAALAASNGNGNGTDCTVRLPVSKTLVAARLGVKKETLSRLLRSLETRGLIAVERREVRILDRTGLAAVTR